VVGNPTTTPTAPSGPTVPVTAPTTPAGPASSVTFRGEGNVPVAPAVSRSWSRSFHANTTQFLTGDVASVVARRELPVYSTPEFSPATDTGERVAPKDKVRVISVAVASTGEPRLRVVGGYISAANADVRRPVLRGPNAEASIALDLATGEVLWEADADEEVRIASVTKLLAVFLVRDWLAEGNATWDTAVPMTDKNLVKMSKDWNTGGFVFKRGASYSVRDLYTLSIVESSNAAITALGITVAGSNEKFLDAMNTKAREIGMDSSTFISVSGLDNPSLKPFGFAVPGTGAKAGNISTAADVGRLAQALLAAYPDVLHTSGITKTTVGGKKVTTTNQLLRGGKHFDSTLGITGLKTGYTSAAGYCLVATSAKAGRHPVLAVVLGAKTSKARFTGTRRLLHSIYDRWGLRSPTAAP
jgi:D-alanyl-D-alanine carboxypeptidase